MTGRLWRLNSEGWHIELDGEHSLVAGFEMFGATVRSSVATPGATFHLPGNPTAMLEFECQAIMTTPHASAANDNNRADALESK